MVALTPKQIALREIACRLYYQERKSTAEVARLLDEPESTIWNILTHCTDRHRLNRGEKFTQRVVKRLLNF